MDAGHPVGLTEFRARCSRWRDAVHHDAPACQDRLARAEQALPWLWMLARAGRCRAQTPAAWI